MSRTSFGERYLKSIDAHLLVNCRRMSRSALADIYWEVFRALNKESGGSPGFAGLTEYVIFKFVCHAMGGKFRRKSRPNTTQGCADFQHTASGYVVSRNRHYDLSVSVTPDVVVLRDDKVEAAYEVKVYPNGTQGLKEEVRKLATLRRSSHAAKRMRGILVFFDASKRDDSKVMKMLGQQEKTHPWLRVVWLGGERGRAFDALAKGVLPPAVLVRKTGTHRRAEEDVVLPRVWKTR